MEKNNKNKRKIRNKIGLLLLSIQLLVTIVFSYFMLKLDLLPMSYLMAIIFILALLFLLVSYSQLNKKIHTFNRVGAKFLSAFISVCLVLGASYINGATIVLDNITNPNDTTLVNSIVVLADAEIRTYKYFDDHLMGIQTTDNRVRSIEVLNDFEEEYDVNARYLEYNNYLDLVEGLYNGETAAIVINEDFRSLIEGSYPEFSTETRVIKQFKKTIKALESTSDVDVVKEPFNVYISGMDEFGDLSTVSRSDVNMLATINPETKDILLTSTPRDYYIPLACSEGFEDKLTHSGIYGIECSKETIESLYDIEVDFYGKLNFSSFVDIIQALGGLEVYSEYAFTSVNGFEFSQGYNLMYGDMALAFVRERQNLPNGDLDRGKNQQSLIEALVKKAASPTILQNYSEILKAVSGSFETNMPSGDIARLVKMQLKDMAGWRIKMQGVEGFDTMMPTYSLGLQEVSVLVPDYATVETAKLAIDAVMNPVAGE